MFSWRGIVKKHVYTIYWEITGTAIIEADSVEEAQLKFDRLTAEDLVDDGEFTNADPVLKVEE